jgi:hypothetical protein
MPSQVCPGCRMLVSIEIVALDDHCEFRFWINPINPLREYKLSQKDREYLKVERIIADV